MIGTTAVGRMKSTLDLGRSGTNLNTYLLNHHEESEGSSLVNDLTDQGVLSDRNQAKTRCLNFVSVWRIEALGNMAATPLFISLLFCVVWPPVAVLRFGADVQNSIQTGVTIAGFVVTASKSAVIV